MGEAKRTGPHGGYFGTAAPLAFIKAWFAAGSEQDVLFTDRQMGDGTWIVLAQVGSFAALLTPEQCRGVADEFAKRIDAPDVEAILPAVSDLIVALRGAADELERLHPSGVA